KLRVLILGSNTVITMVTLSAVIRLVIYSVRFVSLSSVALRKTLPFGLRSATIACQRTTKAAAFILNNHGIMADVYIDDFYGAAQPTSSHHAFACMNRLFSELGLQASPEKDTPPSCEMTCLGVQINTASMVLTVPQFRLQDLQAELSSWSHKTSCTRKDLQRLLGKLAFVTSCVRPGRAFMCRLINTLKQAPL
ncbi:hypothetical protein ACROYT_G032601, partial [Oculina patagonica]